jgi:hypothetical protein
VVPVLREDVRPGNLLGLESLQLPVSELDRGYNSLSYRLTVFAQHDIVTILALPRFQHHACLSVQLIPSPHSGLSWALVLHLLLPQFLRSALSLRAISGLFGCSMLCWLSLFLLRLVVLPRLSSVLFLWVVWSPMVGSLLVLEPLNGLKEHDMKRYSLPLPQIRDHSMALEPDYIVYIVYRENWTEKDSWPK